MRDFHLKCIQLRLWPKTASSAFPVPSLHPAVVTENLVLQPKLGRPQAAAHSQLIHHLFVPAGIHSEHGVLRLNEEGIDMQPAQQIGFSSN